MQRIWIILLTAALPLSAFAQLEEIVVTGSRIGGYSDMPAVTVTKSADFLVQNIRLVNDSRSLDLRKSEIVKTIESLLARADKMDGMAISYGSGFLEPIDLTDESLQLIEDRQRTDTSYVDIYAKIALDTDRGTKEQIADLREFVSGVRKSGRTEILPMGDIGLSIVGPEQYRYEIIQKIAAENEKIAASMSAGCSITIGGLENRVQWQRSSISELTLYIPYGLEISSCTT